MAVVIEAAVFTPQTPSILKNYVLTLGSGNFELASLPHVGANPRDQRGAIDALGHFYRSIDFWT